MSIVYHKCPTCGANENMQCRTPSGKFTKNVHTDRQFSIKGLDKSLFGSKDSYDKPPKEVLELFKMFGL